MDYTSCDRYIKNSLESGCTIDDIKLLGTTSEAEAEEILEDFIDKGWDEDLTLETWFSHVDTYRKHNPIPIKIISSTLGDAIEEIDLSEFINDPASSWRALKSNFAASGISNHSIQEIESSAHSVLSRLSSDTRDSGPRKGLVFGSVQSGKTANMEALISMAADTQWNVFIILTGTIESLRVQTRDRFKRDLKNTASIAWRHIDLSGDDRSFTTTQMKLNIKDDYTYGSRYVITCLKQKSRLKKLISWLYADRDKARRMRLIVIDDEADQASINTAHILTDEQAEEYEQDRKEINRLIVCLANGLLSDSSIPGTELQAMNYISYTATPYANVLNEPPGESLYPKDFVHALATPDEYFGIEAIFGNSDYISTDGESLAPGLDIIREIPVEDSSDLKLSHKEGFGYAPESLKDAISWFLCCIGALRTMGHRKPISMLVHTTNRGAEHKVDYHLVSTFLKSTPCSQLLDRCQKIYETETTRFTYDDLARDFSSYGLLDQVKKALPPFSAIAGEIEEAVADIGNISFASDEELSYASGINICIDNCYADHDAPDDVKMRLVYPTRDQLDRMAKAPAFIVVGGNTLARGLTLEGLTCTYFMRNTRQADTLMQMARWFGYRKGYELLQRVWLTDEVRLKFEALARVEMNLKEDIKRYDEIGMRPDQLGVKVRTMPEIRNFTASAKNKMQRASACDYNFTGYSYEITEFDSSLNKLSRNIELTDRFLTHITDISPITRTESAVVWKGINSSEILDYVSSYSLSRHSSITDGDIKNLVQWITGPGAQAIDNWNVAVAGKYDSPGGTWSCSAVNNLPKVERSRVLRHPDWIDIHSLRSGADALCDLDENDLSPEQRAVLNAGGKTTQIVAKRAKLGLDRTPLLLIYRIDAASRSKSRNRVPINSPCDVISFSVIIPGDKHGSDGVEAVSIRMDKE